MRDRVPSWFPEEQHVPLALIKALDSTYIVGHLLSLWGPRMGWLSLCMVRLIEQRIGLIIPGISGIPASCECGHPVAMQ